MRGAKSDEEACVCLSARVCVCARVHVRINPRKDFLRAELLGILVGVPEVKAEQERREKRKEQETERDQG